jgi:ABC-type transport system involved in cytochrome c biogenesis permease subunit
MTIAFNLSLAGYLAALLFSVADVFSSRRRFGIAVTTLLSAGLFAQTVYMIWRWAEAGRAPFSNMYESLVLFAWAVVAVYLGIVVGRATSRGAASGAAAYSWLAAAAALLAALTLAYASTYHDSAIKPLMPALRSNWLTFHVLSCFLGYGAFAVGAAASIGYLITGKDAFDDATARTISFGFLFLTVGIIAGAVWANSAWGTYWSWDPKETWSLITWLIYAVFLHCRFLRGWKGKRAAWISVLGFASVIFTYFGVNYLLSGLHSYANA